MLNTKIIFVDGISGSGKSTTAHFIARQIEKNGHKVRWFYEEEDDHPLAEMVQNKDESDTDFAQRILKDYPQKWIDFVNKVKDDDCIYIVESFLFQNIIFTPLAINIDKQTIKEFVHKLCSIAACMNPVVIHFHQQDIEAAVRANWQRRGKRWKDMIVSIAVNNLFCTSRGLAGETGSIKVWQEESLIANEIFKELTFPKIQLENSKHDWSNYRKQILDFLELQKFDELLYDSSFEKYCGNYFGVKIHVRDNRLCADLFWVNLKMMPVGEDEFIVEGFPIRLKFITDADNQINSLIFINGVYTFKTGEILHKYVPPELNQADLEKLCGDYWCESEKLERKIYLKEGNLYYYRKNLFETRLLPVTETKFIMHESLATLNFELIDNVVKFFLHEPGGEDIFFVPVETV